MLTRRLVRVKVMQLLYISDIMGAGSSIKNPAVELDKFFNKSRSLIAFILESLCSVAAYAESDALQKASKHIVTEKDLNVNTKIAGNAVIWALKENSSFAETIKQENPKQHIETELVKKWYNKLLATAEYDEYIATNERGKKEECRILKFLLSDILLQDEAFVSLGEDLFSNWDDDIEVLQLLAFSILDKPEKQDFNKIVSGEKWEFGKTLLQTVLTKNDYLNEIIVPRLRNWDADRVANLDMILLRMAISEFLYFETIPTKVTINEYIDLAKEYSTHQSGAFINGLLDGVLKEFTANKTIIKTAFVKFKS